jgi:hypothetical protein
MVMAGFALCDAISSKALLLSPPFVVKENQPLPSSRGRNHFNRQTMRLMQRRLAICATLRQPPATALDVEEQADVAKDLELLADFVFDVAARSRFIRVVGMELFQFVGEGPALRDRWAITNVRYSWNCRIHPAC